jgi:hypothetical protein
MFDLTEQDIAVLLIVIAATCAFVIWHFWPRVTRDPEFRRGVPDA